MVALNLVNVWIDVRINQWNNDFYNAIQNTTGAEFCRQLGIFGDARRRAIIVVLVYPFYLQQMLQIRWRRWLTERYLGDWLGDRAYYRLQLDQAATDNPDQRIADDLERFTGTEPRSVARPAHLGRVAVSFLFILWGLSGPLRMPLGGWGSFTIPGYMVLARDASMPAVGTLLTHQDRPAAGALELCPAALRGRFPLQPGAAARKRRERRLLSRRRARARDLSTARFARVVATISGASCGAARR